MMLMLGRKKGETIVIPLGDGERVTITVVRIDGNEVKLGITAPKSIPVHRGEIQRRIDAGEIREEKEGMR